MPLQGEHLRIQWAQNGSSWSGLNEISSGYLGETFGGIVSHFSGNYDYIIWEKADWSASTVDALPVWMGHKSSKGEVKEGTWLNGEPAEFTPPSNASLTPSISHPYQPNWSEIFPSPGSKKKDKFRVSWRKDSAWTTPAMPSTTAVWTNPEGILSHYGNGYDYIIWECEDWSYTDLHEPKVVWVGHKAGGTGKNVEGLWMNGEFAGWSEAAQLFEGTSKQPKMSWLKPKPVTFQVWWREEGDADWTGGDTHGENFTLKSLEKNYDTGCDYKVLKDGLLVWAGSLQYDEDSDGIYAVENEWANGSPAYFEVGYPEATWVTIKKDENGNIIDSPTVNPFEAAKRIRELCKKLGSVSGMSGAKPVLEPSGLSNWKGKREVAIRGRSEFSNAYLSYNKSKEKLKEALKTRRVTEIRAAFNELDAKVDGLYRLGKDEINRGIQHTDYANMEQANWRASLHKANANSKPLPVYLLDELRMLSQCLPTVPDLPQGAAENVIRAFVAILRSYNVEGSADLTHLPGLPKETTDGIDGTIPVGETIELEATVEITEGAGAAHPF